MATIKKPVQLGMIPALDGFYVIEPTTDLIDGKEVPAAFKTPIVGWVQDAEGCVSPVTVFEVLTDHSYILFPNGEVSTYSSRWNTLVDWLTDDKRGFHG